MKHKRIKPEIEKHQGWTRWIKPFMRGYLMGCCDCGLHHWMDFKVHRGRVYFRAKRAPGYTRRDRAKQRHPMNWERT